jgi:GT2 family glycosyltransferase
MQFNVSIIIPALNSTQVNDLLLALSQQTCKEAIQEIILVGQQNFENLVNDIDFKYIHVEKEPTPARNRNIGVQHAKGDWICFTDTDCIPRPDWLARFMEFLTPEVNIMAGTVDVPAEISYWGRCDHLLAFGKQVIGISNRKTLEYAATLNFCMRKDLFLGLNGFNESFRTPSAEDREFCYRIRKNSDLIYLIPDAIVIHNHNRLSFRSCWNHLFHYGEATATFRMIHQEKNSSFWKTERILALIPVLGEFFALVRIFIRFWIRIFSRNAMRKYFRYQLGIAILDLAHTMGMIYTLRAYAAKDRNRYPELE